MPNFLLDIEYEGTDFAGWQLQPKQRTVQGELEKACSRLAGRKVRVTGAGRTDAGVHAAGQAASVQLPWRHGCPRLIGAINGNLPRDVAVTRARKVPARFDARKNALERRYRYLILRRETRSPLLRRFALLVSYPINVERMRQASGLFKGKHDFSAFCTEKAQKQGAVRRLTKLELGESGDILALDFAAPGFLHHMVRMIVGALLAAGRGRLKIAQVRQALAGRKARLAPLAPAHGLCLLGVRYPGRTLSPPFFGRISPGAISRARES